MTAAGLLLLGLGVVLITAGIRDLDPREMVVQSIEGKSTANDQVGGMVR